MEVRAWPPSNAFLTGTLAREGEMGAESDGKTRSELDVETMITARLSPMITQQVQEKGGAGPHLQLSSQQLLAVTELTLDSASWIP